MKIIVSTTNQDKMKELKRIAQPYSYELISLSKWCLDNNINCPEIPETGTTFQENALIKAKKAFEITHLPSLAEDSGLVVPSLKGKPGIFSARFAISDSSKKLSSQEIYSLNRSKLIRDLNGVSDRNAYFICAACLFLGDNKILTADGKCYGEITLEDHIGLGFGYDPIFFVKEENKTFSHISIDRKNQISHRGVALRRLFALFTPPKQCVK